MPYCGRNCRPCASQQVRETHVAAQYQTEIPRTVIYRGFDVHVGWCDDCGRPVAGRHALQTNSARGAAASQLGPRVHALLAILNKELGLSHGKSVKLLRTLFPELHLARATSVRSMLRTAARCAPTYEQLRTDVRGAAEVAPDETAVRGAVRLPRAVLALVDRAFALRRAWRGHRLSGDDLAEQGLALAWELEHLASGRFMHQPNRRLAGHLLNHAMHWFWLLIDPAIQATNHWAEQAIRPAVVNHKVWGGNRTWPGATAQRI